jgi:hypothetical protein
MKLDDFEAMADSAIAHHKNSSLLTTRNPSFSFCCRTDIRSKMTGIDLRFLGINRNGLYVFSADAIEVKKAIAYYRMEFLT